MVDTSDVMANVNALVDASGLTPATIAQRLGESEQKIKRTLDGKNPSFVSLCGIITTCGGSVDAVIGNASQGAPVRNDPLVSELRSIATYERQRARTWSTLFVVLALVVIAVFIYDAFNPHIGWIRYAAQAAAHVAETAVHVLHGVVDRVIGHEV